MSEEHFSYDLVGNRLTDDKTSTNWNYNKNNELQSFDTTSFKYNLNGQMTEKTVAGNKTYYSYNLDGRLKEIKDNSSQVIAQYEYDPFGRRTKKYLPQTSETIYFNYSDEGLIGEYDESGSLVQSYGYKPNSLFTTNPIFTHRPDFTDEKGYAFYINDHLGTPQKLILKNGRAVWEASADAFGETIVVKNEFKNPFRFPGQFSDKESTLRYNWHRYYDTQIGRYPSSDPIGLEGGINSYIYANSNPLILIDPFGLASFLGIEGDVAMKGLIGGGGLTKVNCCDENDNERVFYYWKICAGLGTGRGPGGAATGGYVRNLEGKQCRSSNYEGYFLEFNLAANGRAVGVDLGYTSAAERTYVDEGGIGMGTSGASVMICHYYLISEKIVGRCDCTD